MTLSEDDARATFEYFSSEYADALQALEAIERQAETLKFMGHEDELRQFVEQFIEMASRTREQALEKKEANFAEWFSELLHRASRLRA
jgi:hypothetical protein